MIYMTFGMDSVTIERGEIASDNKVLAETLTAYMKTLPGLPYHPDTDMQTARILESDLGLSMDGSEAEEPDEPDEPLGPEWEN